MAFSSEIIAKLGLNTADFQSKLATIPVQVERIGMEANKTLQRTFSVGNIFKGFLQGLGIGSALAVMNQFTTAIREAATHSDTLAGKWADIATSARSAAAEIAKIGKSDTEVHQQNIDRLARLKQQRDALLGDTGRKTFFGGLVHKGSGADALFGFSRRDEQERLDRVKKINDEINKLTVETRRHESANDPKATDERVVARLAGQMKDKATAEKQLAEFERDQRRAKIKDDALILDLTKEKAQVDKKIATIEHEKKMGAEFTAEGIEDLLQFKERQLELEKEIADVTKRKQDAEKAIGTVVESNIEKWREFSGEIRSFGRGDRELSDRELAKKISTTQADISMREIALRGQVGGVGGGPFDLLLEGQRINLQQAINEQRLREDVRRNARFFGEDRAFEMFGGNEQRFRDILAGSIDQNTQLQREIRDDIRILKESFRDGTARTLTLPLNPGG